MPMLPLAKIVIKVEVAVPAVVEAIVKSGVFAVVPTEFEIERSEYGVVVPIPINPLEPILILSVPAVENFNWSLSAPAESSAVIFVSWSTSITPPREPQLDVPYPSNC